MQTKKIERHKHLGFFVGKSCAYTIQFCIQGDSDLVNILCKGEDEVCDLKTPPRLSRKKEEMQILFFVSNLQSEKSHLHVSEVDIILCRF